MKTIFKILLISIILKSCKQNDEVLKSIEFNSFKEWYAYHYNEIDLNSDFDARTSNNEKISKTIFLDSLKSGKFIPINVQNKGNKKIYFLQKIDKKNSDFSSAIIWLAETQIFYSNLENKEFPKFNFTDINGNNYTSENTKNKTIFLKTYYIACQACNEEMPELNAFVEKNKNKKNLIFLSLALDSSEKLRYFLSNKGYKYNFIPSQENFIKKKLNLYEFPTHFIIENGIIKKVCNSSKDVTNYYQ